MQYTCFSDGPTFSASNPFKYIIQHTGKLTPYLLLYPSLTFNTHGLHTNWSQPKPCWNTYRSRSSRATKKPSNQVSGSLCKCKMNQNDEWKWCKCSALHLVWFQTVPDDPVLAAGSAAVGRCFLAGLESSRLQGTKFAALKTMWYDGILMGL